MRLPIALTYAWLALLLAPVAMIIGHQGTHDLAWTRDHISTYATQAPYAGITASMLLSAFALACLGISVLRDRQMGSHYLGQLSSMIMGAAVSGLLLLASFQETAPDKRILETLDLDALRQQMFHDSGLFIFFSSSVAAALLAGFAIMLIKGDWRRRVAGGMIAATGPAAVAALSHGWTHSVGIAGKSSGIRQRLAFFFLWIGALLLLVLLTKETGRNYSRSQTIEKPFGTA